MKALNKNQQEALYMLSNYVGKEVFVQTSYYDTGICPEFLKKAIGHIKPQTLRSLEKRGYIELDLYWKGATVKVLPTEQAK